MAKCSSNRPVKSTLTADQSLVQRAILFYAVAMVTDKQQFIMRRTVTVPICYSLPLY